MEPLFFRLGENLLTADPSDYKAIVETSRSNTIDDVIKMMLKRGTSMTKTDILAVLNLYDLVVADLVAEGKPINLPLFTGAPSITGVFNGPADVFDPARHAIRYNLNPGLLLREAIQRIPIEKTAPVENLPIIEQYLDVASQKANDVLTPGDIGELQGSRIGFDAADAEQGIWFVDTNGTETKVSSLAMNKPSKLIFKVPALVAGEYELVLRVKFANSKQLRKVTLRKMLTVPAL
jgi:hypothetical protein